MPDGSQTDIPLLFNSLALGRLYHYLFGEYTSSNSFFSGIDNIVDNVLIFKYSDMYGYVLAFQRSGSEGIYKRNLLNGTWGSWQRIYDEGILNQSSVLGPLASALGVELNKYNGLTVDGIPDLKSNHQNTIETGAWNKAVSSNYPPSPEGYDNGQYIWIPTLLPQSGNTFGILIATAMTEGYQIKYYYCSKWYQTWDVWHELS